MTMAVLAHLNIQSCCETYHKWVRLFKIRHKIQTGIYQRAKITFENYMKDTIEKLSLCFLLAVLKIEKYLSQFSCCLIGVSSQIQSMAFFNYYIHLI